MNALARRPVRAWKAFLAANVALAAVYAAVPPAAAKLAVWPVVGWSAVAAVVVGVRLHRPAVRAAWWLLGAGLATFIVGDNLYSARNFVQHAEALFPSYVDVVYLAMYPLLVGGLVLLVRRRTPHGDRESLLDAAILTGGLGLLSWVLLIDPYVTDQGMTVVERLVSIAYPVGDVAILAVLLRLAVGGGRRPAAFWLLAGGTVALLGADFAYGWLNLTGGWHEHHVIDAGWMAFYALWGAAALHPSMSSLTRPVTDPPVTGRRRVALVGAAALVPPALLLVEAARHDVSDPVAIGTVSVLLFGLVLVRTAGLARKAASNQVEARFRALVQHAIDAVVVVDRAGRITYQTPSTTRVLGREGEILDGMALAALVHPDDRRLVDVVLEGPVDGERLQWRVRRSDGAWRTFEVDVADLGHESSVGGTVLTMRDTTHRLQLEDELRRRAFHDNLTGLANRALFVDRLSHALALDERRGAGVAVLYLDLDDFKVVNDGLGHCAGDELLVAVARRLESSVRPGDTVARLGGDEFAVLLEHGEMPAAADEVAARIVDAFEPPLRTGDREIPVRTSIGIAFGRAVDEVAADLLRDADIAMYIAKRNGKGRWVRFAPEMQETARRRLELANDLAGAIAGGALHVLYQPIVDLTTLAPIGAEALVRWDHPTYGRLSPAEFIPIAEASGLIVPLGRWVLEEACRVAQSFRQAGHPSFHVTVNVSGRQLLDGNLAGHVAAALDATGLPAANLVLEVTESVLVDNVDTVREGLQALKDLGLRLAVDDFGTGYSSLSYLGTFPVDVVKIDKSFVDRVALHAEGAAVVRAVVDLGASLGLDTVAEGIEDPEQLVTLRGLGCDNGQGYLFDPPITATALAEVLTGARPAGRPARPSSARAS